MGDPTSRERRFEHLNRQQPCLVDISVEQVELVSPTDSTVACRYETAPAGFSARARSHISSRCGRAFVKLNCRGLCPLDLLESELRPEKGRVHRRHPRRRSAGSNWPTKARSFLYEVCDIPPALQPKVLRVLEEAGFERLGSALRTTLRPSVAA